MFADPFTIGFYDRNTMAILLAPFWPRIDIAPLERRPAAEFFQELLDQDFAEMTPAATIDHPVHGALSAGAPGDTSSS